MVDEPQICCPQCGYRPRADDRWRCVPRCVTSWHTFWTGGVCPGCGIRWDRTQCPACGEISPHGRWYHASRQASAGTRERDVEHG